MNVKLLFSNIRTIYESIPDYVDSNVSELMNLLRKENLLTGICPCLFKYLTLENYLNFTKWYKKYTNDQDGFLCPIPFDILQLLDKNDKLTKEQIFNIYDVCIDKRLEMIRKYIEYLN